MKEQPTTIPAGIGVLVTSWFLFPFAFILAMWLLPFHRLSYSVMGVVYQAYGITALYYSVFCTLSIIKYRHPHWVRIVYGIAMMVWCCGFHYVFEQALGAC